MKFSALKTGQRFRAYGLAGVWIKTAARRATRMRGHGLCYELAPAIMVTPV